MTTGNTPFYLQLNTIYGALFFVPKREMEGQGVSLAAAAGRRFVAVD